MSRISLISSILALLLPMSPALAEEASEEAPQQARHEIMEGVGKAAKPIGAMFKGEADYDPEIVMQSLQVWSEAAEKFGGLFPQGSETGYDTEARDTIWSDRAGFDESLTAWQDSIQAAIAENPQNLDLAKPILGGVFKQCKSCHEAYRVEKED